MILMYNLFLKTFVFVEKFMRNFNFEIPVNNEVFFGKISIFKCLMSIACIFVLYIF